MITSSLLSHLLLQFFVTLAYSIPLRKSSIAYRPIVPTAAEIRANCIDTHSASCTSDSITSLTCINKNFKPVNGLCPRVYDLSPDGVIGFGDLIQSLPLARNLTECMEQFEIAISTFPSQDKTGVKVYPQMIWTELSKKCSITGSYPHKSFLYLKGHKVFSAVARQPDGITPIRAQNLSRNSFACTSKTCNRCPQELGFYYGQIAAQECLRCPDRNAETCDPLKGFTLTCVAGSYKPVIFGDCQRCDFKSWSPPNNQLTGKNKCIPCFGGECDRFTGGPPLHCSYLSDLNESKDRLNFSSRKLSSFMLHVLSFIPCSS